MAYPLANHDLIEIQIVGTLHGQETRNVFHYYVALGAPITDGREALLTAIADFAGTVYEGILSFQSEEWTCSALTIQKIAPQRYRQIKYIPSDLLGDVASGSLPSSSAAVISRYAEQAGRAFQGRLFIPGVPIEYEEDSRIDSVGMANLNGWAGMLTSQLALSTGSNLIPTLAHTGNDPVPQRVIEAVPTDVLRVQRRREVGRGS